MFAFASHTEISRLVLMIASLLFFYGLFLIACGITAVIFIGMKAKTALVSGGTSGILAMTAGHFVNEGSQLAIFGGLFLSLGLVFIFAWRSKKTLFALFVLIRSGSDQEKGKGIAFLIIALMAVVSVVVTILQAVALVQ